MKEQLALLPGYLTAHLQLALFALLAGTAVSIPAGIAIARSRRLERPVLAVASVIQTVPSLALLAVMVPALSALGLRSIGFLPAFIGLTLYSVLPVLRNTVTGLLGLDPALKEAARGVGMTAAQQLWRVELPRSFARRVAEYLSLLIIGPILLVGFIGLSGAALKSSPLRYVQEFRLMQQLGGLVIQLAPYVMVTGFFTALYMFIPNTRVQWRSALIGAIAAGILWAAVGKMFTALVVFSTGAIFLLAGLLMRRSIILIGFYLFFWETMIANLPTAVVKHYSLVYHERNLLRGLTDRIPTSEAEILNDVTGGASFVALLIAGLVAFVLCLVAVSNRDYNV